MIKALIGISIGVLILSGTLVMWTFMYMKRHSKEELEKLVEGFRKEMDDCKKQCEELKEGMKEETENSLLKLKGLEVKMEEMVPARENRSSNNDENEEIIRLYKKGESIEEISKKMKRNTGEIKVIISYNDYLQDGHKKKNMVG
ncbi:DUF6115 domain-containing protein [Bacillus bombysepticus]|uniref:DUF6115 domain-containing protein n=1 Tax=Bacillus bombysepticus TaxID=658666 RepID=UPI003016C4AA